MILESPNSRTGGVADPSAYQFQMALIGAIAAHIRALRRVQFKALHYRGADFGRVISVELYFRLINDAALRSAFDRHTSGERLPDHPDDIPISTVANWVFEHIRRTYKNPLKTRVGAKYYVRAFLDRWRHGVAEQLPKPTAQTGSNVAFLALSLRYYRYLRPIASKLGEPVIWIVPEEAGWTDEIATDRGHYVTFPTTAGRMPELEVGGPLENWRSTLRRYDDLLEVVAKISPSLVVLAEGNNADDELLALAARALGAKSVCIQQGWSPVIHNGFRQMQFDLFCVWGKEFARMLRPFNRRQRFAVTGSHIVTPLLQKANPDAGDISIFLQKDSLLISNAAWLGMLDFISWCSRTWPDRQVLVREHPAAPLNAEELAMIGEQPNIRLCRAQDISLIDVLDRSAISVAIFSTTLIEAVGRHVVPLIVNVTGAPSYCPDLDALGVGIEVKNFEEAKTAMTDLFAGRAEKLTKRAPAVMNRFFATENTVALDNIAALIKRNGNNGVNRCLGAGRRQS